MRWPTGYKENAPRPIAYPVSELYDKLLKGTVETPFEKKGKKHVYHLYVLKTKERDLLKRLLKEKNINCGIHYPIPLHMQPAYKHMNLNEGSFPETEKAAKDILSLPMYPELKATEIQQISKEICSIMQSNHAQF